MNDEQAREYAEKNKPRHVASLRKQATTHERAVKRKEALQGQPKQITRKEMKKQAMFAARTAKKVARHAKHARKLARV